MENGNLGKERFVLLVKFFDEKRWADKMRAGQLYARRLKWFRTTEDAARADEDEGQYLLEDGELSISGDDGDMMPLEGIVWPVRFSSHVVDNLNVFCMTMFESDAVWPSWEAVEEVEQKIRDSLHVHSRMGGHVVMVSNPAEFFRRVDTAVKREGFQRHRNRVQYYDSYPLAPTIKPRPTFEVAFLKRRAYELEREYRIALNTRTDGENPVTLEIGDISDITVYMETRRLSSLPWKMKVRCPWCWTAGCVIRRPKRAEHPQDEYDELNSFSCYRCGEFSVTEKAGAILEQMDPEAILAAQIVPKWNSLAETFIVDSLMAEEACNQKASTA